jgi:hypothetical protein
MLPLLSIVALTLSSQSVLANPIAPAYEVFLILIPINLPVNGLLLMVMYALFVRFAGAPRPLAKGRFVELVLESVLVITFTGAMIDTAVLYGAGAFSMAFGAVMIAAIVSVVSRFALSMSPTWSLLTGAVFLVINLAMWVMLDSVGDIWVIVAMSFLCMLGFIILTANMTFTHHSITRPVAWDAGYRGGSGEGRTETFVLGSYLHRMDGVRGQLRVLIGVLVVFLIMFVFFWA